LSHESAWYVSLWIVEIVTDLDKRAINGTTIPLAALHICVAATTRSQGPQESIIGSDSEIKKRRKYGVNAGCRESEVRCFVIAGIPLPRRLHVEATHLLRKIQGDEVVRHAEVVLSCEVESEKEVRHGL